MARVKHAFDPHGMLNPGKMWETTAADLDGLVAGVGGRLTAARVRSRVADQHDALHVARRIGPQDRPQAQPGLVQVARTRASRVGAGAPAASTRSRTVGRHDHQRPSLLARGTP